TGSAQEAGEATISEEPAAGLAAWAVLQRRVGERDLPDDLAARFAVPTAARLARPAVYAHPAALGVLELGCGPPGRFRDGGGEHPDDGVVQRGGPLGVEGRRRREGARPGDEQDLVGVRVADPRDDPLLAQQPLDLVAPRGEQS